MFYANAFPFFYFFILGLVFLSVFSHVRYKLSWKVFQCNLPSSFMTLVNLDMLWLWGCGSGLSPHTKLSVCSNPNVYSSLSNSFSLIIWLAPREDLQGRLRGPGCSLDWTHLSATWNKSVTRLSVTAPVTEGKAANRGLWVDLRWDPWTCALGRHKHETLFISTVQRTTTQPASPPTRLSLPHVWLNRSGVGEGSHENKWVRGWLKLSAALSLWAHISYRKHVCGCRPTPFIDPDLPAHI